jgi:hypothetical protein
MTSPYNQSLADRCRRMGFDVETSLPGCNALIKPGNCKLNLLSKLDGRWPQLLDGRRSSWRVVVIAGQADLKTAATSRVLKGRKFWSRFDAVLSKVFSELVVVVKQRPVEISTRNRPRVLLIDGDLDVRTFILPGFKNWELNLLSPRMAYRVSGRRGEIYLQ